MNPDFPKGLSNLACTLVRRDPVKAIPYIERAVALAPGSVLYMANLVLITSHTLSMVQSRQVSLREDQLRQIRQLHDQTQGRLRQLQPGYMVPTDCTWEFVPAG